MPDFDVITAAIRALAADVQTNETRPSVDEIVSRLTAIEAQIVAVEIRLAPAADAKVPPRKRR